MASATEQQREQFQELVIRLERNNNMIQRLSKKVNSYTCEPNNSSCFEKLYDLRHSFKVFSAQQKQIVSLLNQNTGEGQKLHGDIQSHLERFKELERDIAAYLLATGQYH
ncbi:MAG: hypothetical protein AAF969_01935 [Bacteroidota bacterium]